ncbi:MAG: prepilin peptidase [Deltaproteobacteria bacterium]|nr:prepilin peptidase [Deltaproteobacteria bacterium]
MLKADSMEMLWIVFIILFSAVLGSFLNVCIYRIPRGQSIVLPRSHCPNCGRFLRWFHNVPVVSFLLLKGKCSFCHRPISWRYLLVELITVGFALLTFYRFGPTAAFFLYFFFLVAPLIVISFIDLEHRIIPDWISLPGIVLGFLVRLALSNGQYLLSLRESLLGVAIGGGFLFFVAFLYEKLRRQEGLGGGDIKLAAFLGAFLGWQNILFVLPIASLAGFVVALVLVIFYRKGMKYPIPYGPFLSLAGLLQLYYGNELIRWYLHVVLRHL